MAEGHDEPRRFAIAFSEARESAQLAASRARKMLEDLGAQVYSLEQVLDGQNVESLLSIGGDGTLLHAARLMAPRNIPVLGVNFGRVGYLCAAREDQLDLAVDNLFHRKCTLDQRCMIRATVRNRREEVWQVDALNEVLVGGSNRTLTLDVHVNGECMGQVRGDGVIVSTRTGSSAYSYSAGGPLMMLEGLCLVMSNAISSDIITPVVFPLDTVLRITNRTKHARPYVIADGQKDYQIEEGTEIEATVSPLKVVLVDPCLVTPLGKLKKAEMDRR